MAGGVNYIPEEFGKPKEYCHPHHRIPTDLEPAFVIGKDESCCPPTGDPCECVTSGDIEKWNFVYDNFSALADIDVSAINDFVDDVSALNSSADNWNSTFETVSSNSANWNTVDDLKASAEDHEERISDLEDFADDTEDRLSAIDNKLENLHFDNDITDPDHSISGDGSISSPFGVNNYAALKTTNDNYEELNRHIVKFSADSVNNTLYEFDGAAYNVARIDGRLSGIDQTNDTQNTNIQRNYELITEVANRQKGKQDKLSFGYNNSGYIVSINNSALVGEMGGLTGDIQGALDEVYENSANWSEVSAKVDTTAFNETVNSINDSISTETSARIDADNNLSTAIDTKLDTTAFNETVADINDSISIETSARIDADAALSTAIDTKLDTTAFSTVSSTFYTTDNPSGFIDNTVNDLVNYYTTAQTYTQTEINEMLANFGGFEVVPLTTGENPHPDVSEPSTKIIYLTKDSTLTVNDPYTEWIYTENNTWEIIGETTVDLTNYVTFSALNDTLADYQPVAGMTAYYTKSETSGAQEIADALDLKQNVLSAGTDIVIDNDVIGVNTNGIAQGTYAFVEGNNTSAIGNYSHSEGEYTKAKGEDSHSEGMNTFAGDIADHVEGIGGIVEQGGCNHIEGFQYHCYTSNGASTFAGTNVVKFYNNGGFGNGSRFSISGPLYDFVKAFKEKFIITCDYNTSSEYHQSPINSFELYKPLIFNIIDVTLDGDNYINLTLDGNIPNISSGSVNLCGPVCLYRTTGNGGSLSSGQTLNTYIINGSLGFPGNNLENIRTDNAFIQLSCTYRLPGDNYDTYYNRVLKISSIEYDSSNYRYVFTTEEDVIIPTIQGGGYSFNIYVISPTFYGLNHIEGADNSVVEGSMNHIEGYNNFAANCKYSHNEGTGNITRGPAAHAEGISTVAAASASHSEGCSTYANSYYSHSEGSGTTAQGNASHSEGRMTLANAEASHAEGNITTAYGYASHAEGEHTSAVGNYSHAEGFSTSAVNSKSHAEGEGTLASADRAHAEGHDTSASGGASHTEGSATKSLGNASHAEGYGSYASGELSHAEGYCTTASGYASHAEGNTTIAYNTQSHAEGYGTSASGYCSHAEGYITLANESYSHAEGYSTSAIGNASHAEGGYTSAIGYESHAEGYGTSAANYYSHAEGQETQANSTATHAEGYGTVAAGLYSHAEGQNSQTYSNAAHAEGYNTTAAGNQSHAEGQSTLASNYAAHAEGNATVAQGDTSHAEGFATSANGNFSHAAGYYTIVTTSAGTVIGKYNSNNTAAFVVGNGSGTNATARSDAFIVDWDGTVSANKFVEANPDPTLTLTGGTFVEVTEDTANNILTVDLESSLGQMLTELSGVLSAKPATGSRYILGLETNGTLTWLSLNQ